MIQLLKLIVLAFTHCDCDLCLLCFIGVKGVLKLERLTIVLKTYEQSSCHQESVEVTFNHPATTRYICNKE